MPRGTESQLFQEALGIVETHRTSFFSAPWLLSSFESPVWKITCERSSRIDFRVVLDDGLLLTHSRHEKLLKAMKCFLIIQTHPEHTRGVIYSDSTASHRVLSATHICEYLVVNAVQLGLGKFGLQAISASDGMLMLKTLATTEACEGVYGWSERLTAHLIQQGALLTKKELASAIEEKPQLTSLTPGDRTLRLTDDELVRARTWLWQNGHYRYSADGDGRRHILDTSRMMPILYPRGTLKSNWMRPLIPKLQLIQVPKLLREKRGVPVRGEKRSEDSLRYYVRPLRSLRLLERVDLQIPRGLVEATNDRAFLQGLPLEPPGRYRTLPHGLVFTCLRNALEFSLTYAQELLNTYVELAKEATRSNCSVAVYIQSHDIQKFLGPALRDCGVNCWSLVNEVKIACTDNAYGQIGTAEAMFFSRLRKSHGLYEMLLVLGGSLLIILGTLMARRQGELIDLVCGSMFDESRTRLRFKGRKVGTGNIRGSRDRPIPPVAVELLLMVEHFQERLIAAGVIDKFTKLFAFPNMTWQGLATSGQSDCNMMLDRFCDYFEVQLNSKGERFYIRQHQLRRFFAMLFFWGNSFSGLDSLRWFLGHTDSRHLYNYITESTPGDVLRSVKVDFTVERTLCADAQTLPLLDFVEERFHTRDVLLLDVDELAEFIDELMLRGQVTVEPQFFTTPEGERYSVLISVTREQALHV